MSDQECFKPEKDNPYPLCIGGGKPECENCQLWADWEPEDPDGVDIIMYRIDYKKDGITRIKF